MSQAVVDIQHRVQTQSRKNAARKLIGMVHRQNGHCAVYMLNNAESRVNI